MKHYCKYCKEKLTEEENKSEGCCDRCNCELVRLQDEIKEMNEYENQMDWFDDEAWEVCFICHCHYNILDPDSECGCNYYDD